MVPQVSAVLGGVPRFLVVLAIQVLVALHRVSCHLIRPFEERLIHDLFQNLMYRISEHGMYCLCVGEPGLPCKVSPRLVVIVESVRSEIPPLLWDNFRFTFSQLLVFFNPFILVDPVHELAQAGDRLSC